MRWHAAALAMTLVAGCAGDAEVGDAASPGAPTGFRVDLEQEERPAPGLAGAGQVAWETAWALSWEPVAGATSYAIYYGTNEGAGGEPQREVTEPSVRIQAAAGTSPVERVPQDQAAGLLLTSSQLLVSVAAVGSDGQQGTRSPWFPVGDVPADGEPIGIEVEG